MSQSRLLIMPIWALDKAAAYDPTDELIEAIDEKHFKEFIEPEVIPVKPINPLFQPDVFYKLESVLTKKQYSVLYEIGINGKTQVELASEWGCTKQNINLLYKTAKQRTLDYLKELSEELDTGDE